MVRLKIGQLDPGMDIEINCLDDWLVPQDIFDLLHNLVGYFGEDL